MSSHKHEKNISAGAGGGGAGIKIPDIGPVIDTHCHLTSGHLAADVDAVLAASRKAGIVAFLSASTTVADAAAALGLARRNPGVYFSVGVHPHEASDVSTDFTDRLAELAAKGGELCSAVGEIGLDYHYDFSPRDAQRDVFVRQLDLAVQLNLPIIVHSREAFEDTRDILADYSGRLRGVIHSFTAGPDECCAYLDQGWHISFSGIVTFKRSDDNRAAAAIVPDDKLLVETDSPYLSPVPLRGKFPNIPANTIHVAALVAQTRGVNPAELARLTTANACKLFGISMDISG